MASSSVSVTVAGHACQWEWEGDKSVWQQYPLNVQQQISTDFDAGKAEIDIDITNQLTMTIQFAEMIQINKKTKCVRRIRLCLQLKDQTGFYVYQWQNEQKKWESYSPHVMIEIANILAKDQSDVSVTCEKRSYAIDLKKNLQTNAATNVIRKIQCVKSLAKLPSNKRSNETEVETEPANKRRQISKSSATSNSSVIRTVTTVAGQAPVDVECKSLIGKVHVYIENQDVFDCTLNQTNVGNNNNKFYLIQLLEDNNTKNFHVWLRWGRVGYAGQTTLQSFGNQLNDAKRFFCQKFREKTYNDFYHRDTFVKQSGKYDYVQLDYNPSESKSTQPKPTGDQTTRTIPESTLDKRVQNLIQLICNVRAMEEALLEMKFDAKKNPLGKLSSAQIKAGYAALKDIEQFIKTNSFGAPFIEANNTYYTRIPHEFGRQAPPLIKTDQQLKNEIALLEALDDIEVAFSFLATDENNRQNPIDQQYQQLKCQLTPVEKTSEIYKIIDKYLQTTHASTHQQYQMEIEEIFQVERDNENQHFHDVGNKMLLWHGSRLTNFAGILSQGLRIAPPEAPVTGYMFGKGLYFADMSSKSANYCFATPHKNTGLVILSEVALGKWNELLHADSNANKLPSGLSSVKALGSVAPNVKNEIQIDGDVTVPMGPSESMSTKNGKGYTLNYNEYIVYDTKQVRMRYLIKLKFLFK